MTNEEIILKSVQAHLTPAQRHEIAAAAYTPEQIAHAVEHIPDGLDALVASQVHTFAWWKDNGKSVKRGEKALFTCPLWKYTDKPSKAQIKAAEAAGKEVQPAAHYAIATPNPRLGFIHVTPLGNYSAKDLPALPYGLTYEENPGT